MTDINTTMLNYETIVRENLKVKNPVLLKTGVLGTLINIMSHIKYDTASYYQKLLRELNPATAEDFNSLLFHSTTLNYNIGFAKPSTAQINIVISEANLRVTETLTYNIDKDTLLVDTVGNNYTLEEDIKIYINNSTISAERVSSNATNGLDINTIINPYKVTEKLYLIEYAGLKQYKRNFNIFYVPDYEVGEDITNSISIDSYTNIYEINVYLQESMDVVLYEDLLRTRTSEELPDIFRMKKLNIKYNKFNASQFDEDIYLTIENKQLIFNLGNGINGKKFDAGNRLVFEIKTTKGAMGNVNQINIIAPNVLVSSNDDGGYKSVFRTNVKMLSSTGSQNGENLDDIFTIRNKMIKKSNTRDTIVTLNDFQTEFTVNNNKPFVDIKYFNSKNNVFLYNILQDSNKKIINTTTLCLKEKDFNEQLFFPEYTYQGIKLISPFYYKKIFNNYTAYMIKPLIEVNLINDILVDNSILVKNNVTLQIVYDYFERKTKLKLVNYNSLNTYKFSSNQFDVELNKYNNFEITVNQRFLDQYCLFEEPLKDIRLNIFDHNLIFQLEYKSNDIVYQLVEKQKHFTYTELNRLNPSINIKYILNIPYIDSYYFKTTSGRNIYTQLDAFFNITDKQHKIAFNMEVNQSFFNTIDLPELYKNYIVKSNNNGELLNSKSAVILNVVVDKYEYGLSNISSVEELEFKIKALTYALLKSKEGFGVDYYETSLEKLIYDNINIFKNIEVLSPKAFTIFDSKTIYANMEKDLHSKLSILDLVRYVPTYFHYDYDNIRISIEFI